MLVLTGFTGKVDTAGLTEFVTRSFDVGARVWVQDDVYRGEVTRASSMNRYAYVEGAPETYVDVLGFFRAAAALEAQRLAAAEAAWLSAVEAWKQSQPLCGGYYGCYRSKTYEQQYAEASYAAARNAPSARAIETYRQWYAEASYSQARNTWSDRAIETARTAYAEASYQNARNTWSEQAMRTYRQSIADRATLEAEYYQHQAAVELQKTKVFENAVNFSVGAQVGVLEFAWDVVSFGPRMVIEEPVRFLADPGFYIEDMGNRRQEKWDSVKDGWNMVTDIATRASMVQPMFFATFTGDASIGQVWDHVFELGRDYVYGDTIDAYHNADYFSVGKDVGYVAGEVALIVAPIPYVPRLPKVTVAKPPTNMAPFFAATNEARAAQLTSAWRLDPLERGVVIERTLGHNVPPAFKTIDIWEPVTGTATSIKTIDLGATTYQSTSRLQSKLTGYIDDVADYSGSASPSLRITADQIQGRQLLLGIPPGATPAQLKVLEEMTELARSRGVELVVTVVS